jgi:G3E family GTPase
VPLAFVLNLGAYEMDADKEMPREFLQPVHAPHLDTSVVTVTFEQLGEVDVPAFDSWLEGLLWDGASRGMQVMRMKGVVALAGAAQRCIVQGVFEIFDKTLTTPWEAGEPRLNRLVFIGAGWVFIYKAKQKPTYFTLLAGRNLSREQLSREFAACIV